MSAESVELLSNAKPAGGVPLGWELLCSTVAKTSVKDDLCIKKLYVSCQA